MSKAIPRTPSEPKNDARPTAVLRPKDAAALIVIDRSGNEPRVLMGRRRTDLVFLPGKHVFPGGRMDKADRLVESADELEPGEVSRLLASMAGRASPERARALALAAIREAYEEAGILIGRPAAKSASGVAVSESWSGFLAQGVRPALSRLRYFARAITPPDRPRRYDTRFFIVDACHISGRTGRIDGELSSVGWFTLEEMRELDAAGITRLLIEDLAEVLADGRADPSLPAVPFYFFQAGRFRRTLVGG